MPQRPDSLTDRLAERRALKFWRRAAEAGQSVDLETLRALRGRARRMRREIDQLLLVADARLAQPALGSNAMNRPLGADWLWRPSPWRQPLDPVGRAAVPPRCDLTDGVTLFHDCPLRETAYRQRRNARTGDLAPFGLTLDVLGFEGSFLSISLDLPEGARQGCDRRQVFRAEFSVDMERPIKLYARLNIKHGPNTAEIVAHVPSGQADQAAEFDLAGTTLNEKRISKIWLDLIFERPAMSAVTLRDLTLSRRPRSDL